MVEEWNDHVLWTVIPKESSNEEKLGEDRLNGPAEPPSRSKPALRNRRKAAYAEVLASQTYVFVSAVGYSWIQMHEAQVLVIAKLQLRSFGVSP